MHTPIHGGPRWLLVVNGGKRHEQLVYFWALNEVDDYCAAHAPREARLYRLAERGRVFVRRL